MKTGSVDNGLHLNLYNFENCSAKSSSYVLTSPRSLEACRKAGCRPVELLHKNMEEYQDVLGDMALADMRQLYENEEKHRLDKVATCQAIRRELITNDSKLMKENIMSRDEKSCKILSYKDLCGKENVSVAVVKSSNNNNDKYMTLKSQHNSEMTNKCSDSDSAIHETSIHSASPESWNKMLYETVEQRESVSANSRKKKSSISLSRSSSIDYVKHASTLSHLNRKNSLTSKNSSVPACVSSQHHSVTSNSLAATSLSSATLKSTQKLSSCDRNHVGHAGPGVSGNKSVPSSESRRQHKCSSLLSLSDSSRKGNSPDCSLFEYSDLNGGNNREELCLTRTPFPLRKYESFGCLSCDDLTVSEHDHRILSSMALKKELQQESDEFAHQAHILWEEDHEIREHVRVVQK